MSHDKDFYESIERIRTLLKVDSVSDWLNLKILYQMGNKESKAYLAGIAKGVEMTLETLEEKRSDEGAKQ